jgi:hypothetical protein
MSENRLEKAIEAMKNETFDPEEIESAQKRVRRKLEGDTPVCEEFRQDFQDYVHEKLPATRKLLVEDHLSRCPNCRAYLAGLKGERKVAAMPERHAARWPRWATWAAIAAAALCALYLGRNNIDTLLAPRGPIATVASADGELYLVPGRTLEPGSAVNASDVVRTGPDTHARLRLSDGSLVDVNASTVLSVRGAWSGNSIQLQRGDIIVQAAKQRRGHLRVQTRDSLTSVKGTVFAVSSGLSGTLISVVEGSVAVSYSGTDVLLSPGEQEATNPALESSVEQAVSWSPDAETYIGMLASLVQVSKQIAEIPVPQLRPESRLLQFMPPNMFVYGAVPNLGDSLNQAISIMEQQAAENSDFAQWWDFGGGEKLKALADLAQTITAHLGNEIVFGFSSGAADGPEIPVILADVTPGEEPGLDSAIQALNSEANPVPYCLVDTLLLASNTQQNLDWLLANVGQGASSPFASELAARYSSNVNWLFGIDIGSQIAKSGEAAEFPPARQVRYVFFDQRNVLGIADNEVTVAFNGPRTGLLSFLTKTGPGIAGEYITADSLGAAYIATREPQQMFEELLSQFVPIDPSILDKLDQAEATLGIDISNDLARALGAESAFSIEGVSTSGPAWTLAVLVNDSAALESSIQKLVEAFNLGMEEAGQTRRIQYSRNSSDGWTWSIIQPDWSPLSITWTYDGDYMVAASERATALRAIATRNGGFPLIWSSAFQQQLPASAGIQPSGFLWLNAKGAFQDIANLVSNTAVQDLISDRDPILVAFDAEPEQIRAASRTRLSRVFTDLMLLQGLAKTNPE